MKPRRNVDVIHHGMVLISDGRGRGKPARLELTKDALAVQVPIGMDDSFDSQNTRDFELGIRMVTLKRNRDGGLGIAVKGGIDASGEVIPVLISKVFKQDLQPVLFIGDAILEVNGQSAEGRSHDDVVAMLKEAVRHHSQMAACLRRGSSLRRDRSGSHLGPGGDQQRGASTDTGATWKSSIRARSEQQERGGSVSAASSIGGGGQDDAPEGWRVQVKIPLPMAFITRYLWGTDKIRSNAFEVRAVDGTSTGIVHCDDSKALDQWIRHINGNIAHLNNKSIKMSNKYLHPHEQIVYMGWVSELVGDGGGSNGEATTNFANKWEPRFVIFKGSDVCFFETPPLSADDLQRCVNTYRVYETLFRPASTIGDSKQTKREYCFWIETAEPTRHFLSVESSAHVEAFEIAWQRAVHFAITKMQTKTFACNYEGLPCGLVLDLRNGYQLYNIATKKYLWQYQLSQLKASADDGRMRLQFIFDNPLSENNGEDTRMIQDLDCADLYPLIYCLHAYYLARMMATDPEYLRETPVVTANVIGKPPPTPAAAPEKIKILNEL